MEWEVYYSIDPWGEEQSFLQAGIIASTLANINRDEKKKKTPFTPYDFVFKYVSKEASQKLKKALAEVTEMKMKYSTKRKNING